MQALGLIEVVGLAAGFEAADVAVKSANVELVGYELAKGGGYVTIKVLGQVGAVQAAVDAGAQAAEKITRVVSKLVIPRPNDQVEPLVRNKLTVGYTAPKPAAEPEPEPTKVIAEEATEVIEEPAEKSAPAKAAPAKSAAATKTAAAPAARKAPATKPTTGRK